MIATATESTGRARLTTEQASEFLGVKTQTLVNWRCAGRGPQFIRMGKLVRYDRAALEAFIDAQTVKPAA